MVEFGFKQINWWKNVPNLVSLTFDSYICIEVQRRVGVENLQELEVVKYMTITPIVKKHKNSSGNHWKSNLKPTLILNLRNSDLLWLIGYFVTKYWFYINHLVHGYWRNHLLRVIPTILERRNYLETICLFQKCIWQAFQIGRVRKIPGPPIEV